MRNFVFWAAIIGFFVFCFVSFKHVDKTRENWARNNISKLREENKVLSYSLGVLSSEIENETLFFANVSKEFPNYEVNDLAKILNISIKDEKNEGNTSVSE